MSQDLSTRLLHTPLPPAGPGQPLGAPLVRASTLQFDSLAEYRDTRAARGRGERLNYYGIQGTQTHAALEDALCTLEQGERAYLLPTGKAAINIVLLAFLQPGDHALLMDSSYNAVAQIAEQLLAGLGIEFSYFGPDTTDLNALIRPNTRLVYMESPGSLLYEIADLPLLIGQARARQIPVVVDNTWSSGCLLQPLTLGADVSLLAATKYIGGHADLMLGALVCANRQSSDRVRRLHELFGLICGADDAWLALRGLQTLPLRLQRHGQSATEVARCLAVHPAIRRVYFPGLANDPGHALWQRDFKGAASLLTLEFEQFDEHRLGLLLDHLQLFAIGSSWGGARSAVMPIIGARIGRHSSWQGDGPLVRLHIGLEDPQDLIADLLQALNLASGAPAADPLTLRKPCNA